MALILDGLTKTFSSFPAVNNLSYTMDTGVYGLLGVNGAGKTTLMRMLCTLLTPTSGTITWDGQDIFSLGSAYRNLLGYLPQDFGYYPDFSVQDYLLYIASIKGLRPATARQRMQSLLEQVGLTQVRRQKMKKLTEEYDELEQAHNTTYGEFKAVRDDLHRLWKVKSCVDTAARFNERTEEQKLQNRPQTRQKKEDMTR